MSITDLLAPDQEEETYEIPPRVSTIRLNVFELIQVDAEFNEVVGEGDGRPDQTFQLAHDNVLPTDGNGGLELELGTPQPDGGVAWDRWAQVEDLGGRSDIKNVPCITRQIESPHPIVPPGCSMARHRVDSPLLPHEKQRRTPAATPISGLRCRSGFGS